MKLTELESVTHTSLSTLRRDLQDLETEGKVRRVHGGVELLENIQSELSVAEKKNEHTASKKIIGKTAADLLIGGETLFLDAGTTTSEVIPYLTNKKPNVTVVTNSVHHAARLSDFMIPTIIIGGHIKQTTDASIGATAVSQIKQMAFDVSFIGTNGIDEQHGLTTPDLEEAAIKRAVIEQSQRNYVLADDSKLGKVAFAQTAPLEKVTIITNRVDESLSQLKTATHIIEVDDI
jgi:DeoR family fructose operon transcriptional repressor